MSDLCVSCFVCPASEGGACLECDHYDWGAYADCLLSEMGRVWDVVCALEMQIDLGDHDPEKIKKFNYLQDDFDHLFAAWHEACRLAGREV